MKHAPTALILLMAAGCSSVSVDPESMMLMRNIRPPEQIYVQPFNTNSGEWTGVEANSPEFKDSQNASLTKHMIEVLAELVPTQAAPNPLPEKGLLITGEFIKVDLDEGQALTKVVVYDLEKMKQGPAASFQPEASGSLEAVWEKTAVATADWLEVKMNRRGAGMTAPRKKRMKREQQQ